MLWTVLQLAVHIPMFLLLGFYIIVPESVRWLNAKGKTEQVKKILLNRAAMGSALPIPDTLFESESRNDENAAITLSVKDSMLAILGRVDFRPKSQISESLFQF